MKRLVVLALSVAACSGPQVSAQVISTANTIGTGEQRILVEFSEDPGDVNGTMRDENGSPLDDDAGMPVIAGERFVYAFYFDIPEPETYQLTIGDIGPLGFVAVEDPVQVAVGDVAPHYSSRVLLFASEDLCPSETCAAMDDIVDAVTEGGYLSIEVFEDPDADEPVLRSEIEEWRIPGQPWLYIIDADGIVAAVFEGAVTESELREALASE